ncbi:hypothetical protein GHT06_018930 [Daphnia sinensis]|uniref:Uncharacterized protein n=1 Tax=Daphnia sinensis TaxID=1820382 RepID=A0AAD5KN08_9CRUS|nr:hypothetical protein GHT06_018930 [Daphnia sinensis]
MPQNEHIELFQKRYGFRMDYQERQRKKKAREHKLQSKMAQKLIGIKGKIFAKKRYSEKVQLKRTIKAHEEKKTRKKDEGKVPEGAMPAYLLDRENTSQAKLLSSMVKQKRKEKAGKWDVPLPKVRAQSEAETICLQNFYVNPQNATKTADGTAVPGIITMSDEEAQEHFDNFFEDVFAECEDKYGEIEEMNVCDNLGDHLVGNVYIKFRREEDAEKAVNDLNNRWFAGRPVYAELSPVTDFREACCRQYELGECTRSGFCNFMHLKPISRELRRELYGRKRKGRSSSRDRGGSGGPRSSRPDRRRSRSRERGDRRDRSGRY